MRIELESAQEQLGALKQSRDRDAELCKQCQARLAACHDQLLAGQRHQLDADQRLKLAVRRFLAH